MNQIGPTCIYCLRATEGNGEPDISRCLSDGGSAPELPTQPPRLPDAVLPDNPSGKVHAPDAQSVGLYQALPPAPPDRALAAWPRSLARLKASVLACVSA